MKHGLVGKKQMTRPDIKAIEDRANATSMWSADECGIKYIGADKYAYVPQCAHLGETLICLDDTYENSTEDWQFLAHARTDIPALIAYIKELEAKLQIETKAPIFVFGSNLAGRHGKGAALTAVKEYGAVYGRSVGRQGNSYAIPTKDKNLKTLPLDEIAKYVSNFILYAKEHADETFLVTRIGCGLAGYKDKDIAPLFRDAPSNCNLPMGWPIAAALDTE